MIGPFSQQSPHENYDMRKKGELLEAIRGYFTYVTTARYCDIDSGGNKALVMKQFLDDEKVLTIM